MLNLEQTDKSWQNKCDSSVSLCLRHLWRTSLASFTSYGARRVFSDMLHTERELNPGADVQTNEQLKGMLSATFGK